MGNNISSLHPKVSELIEKNESEIIQFTSSEEQAKALLLVFEKELCRCKSVNLRYETLKGVPDMLNAVNDYELGQQLEIS